MYNPVSTYRIQFNKDYNFRDFKKQIGYLSMLGTATVYASPIFEASPGSMHGYDVTNPSVINPEIGKYSDFEDICGKLKSLNIGWLQDIVPNHMAFHMNNKWLMDVLENGSESGFAPFFDIDFDHPDLNGKLIVPFLGKEADEAIRDGEITLDWHNGNFVFRYFDFWFPVSPDSFLTLMNGKAGEAPESFRKLLDEYNGTKRRGKIKIDEGWYDFREKTAQLHGRSAPFREYSEAIKEKINGDKESLSGLLEKQNYKLAFWNESSDRMNYRRFFTVNSLICLKMEDDKVFGAYHDFIAQQVRQGRFNGLRIDHIDGLRKPLYYLEKLRLLAGNDTYIVAEKILQKDEELLPDLPMQGTSGYDYLGIVNNLFTYRKNFSLFRKFYRDITGISDDPEEIIYKKKKFILTWRMHAEWDNLTRLFSESGLMPDGITIESLKEALGEFLLLFPVYKLYSDQFPLTHEEQELLKNIFSKAAAKNSSIKNVLDVLENTFLNQEGFDDNLKAKAISFFTRVMQFTGPLMAKGVEDTTMYFYNCFICHNEVGDDPSSEGISSSEYHNLMINRLKKFPMTMNATSTHDTKRGEDVRARLNVLSEMPGDWFENVRKWISLNSKFKKVVKGSDSPTMNEEYFIYQTLIGVFPFDGIINGEFVKRIEEYMIKSLREAKTETDWNFPDKEHEQAVLEFLKQILDPDGEFMKSFIPFQQKISNFGIVNSLSQVMLKALAPGTPDFYQGTEMWDLSMVDPDNRRPVDYDLRSETLEYIVKKDKEEPSELYKELWNSRNDGRMKLWLTHRLMMERKSDPELFLHGSYIPLNVKGKYRENIIAFARVYENRWYIAVVPLYLGVIPDNSVRKEPGPVKWGDTRIELPEDAPAGWKSSSAEDQNVTGRTIRIHDIMEIPCPVFLKGSNPSRKRSAGVLSHISSLPGKYGTGDLGEEAYLFADFLRQNGQSYWQILPFNPAEKVYGYSPYSSLSAFAGNLTFISPDLLASAGLVQHESLPVQSFRETSKARFGEAFSLRSGLIEQAFRKFISLDRPYQKQVFENFCRDEKNWLDDYALFVILKRQFPGKPWSKWAEDIRNREKEKIQELSSKYSDDILKEKFVQFIFQLQWKKLKSYCNIKGIKIIGDMSFYVNYDSSDVWANPQFFKLDHRKKPMHVGGVPPDYFSETGQLWGMPAYNWESMKDDGYSWWLNRIRRNMDLCDIVRFDHFRGFSEYWEVPASEKTAVNGKWSPGPGHEFFGKIMNEFPDMPFIAEDLGTIDEKVYKLRDDYCLPGMVVLHFAFNDSTPWSVYSPHNHTFNSIVYTGTHDNNTTKGWFMNELDEKYRELAEEYMGHKIDNETCHLDFIRLAYASVARIAIIPIQDILGMGENARLNRPSTSQNNWDWKLTRKDLEKVNLKEIRKMARLYGRA
jgi:malto-oligosyltrehalose synthase/4-alpha-glucanotransferase